MSDREQSILDASMRLFVRYGVKRTSMGDVAKEAGISRQTLYKFFKNKDEILRGHIQHHTETGISEITAGLVHCRNLGEKMDLIFDQMIVVGFDMMQATPNAEEVVEGIGDRSTEELEISTKAYCAVIEAVLSPYEDELKRAGLAPTELADFIQRSATAAKHYSQTREELLGQLDALNKLCIAAACQKPA